MILIPIDEAGAFDALSILEIKSEHGLSVEPIFSQLHAAFVKGIGLRRFEAIYRSDEFATLLNANRAMWDIQEKSMRDECKASDVDKQNQVRYHAKQALQKKFFGGELTERKSVRPYEQESSK